MMSFFSESVDRWICGFSYTLTLIYIALYSLWAFKLKKERISFFAMTEKNEFANRNINNEELIAHCRSSLSTINQLAGISIAILILVVTLLIEKRTDVFELWIITTILILLVISAISYLFSQECFNSISVLSFPVIWNLYFLGSVLWAVGLYTTIAAILISLSLVSMPATIIGCLFACVLYTIYFNARIKHKNK